MKPAETNQSVLKTIHIFEALANQSEPMKLSELSRRVEIPPCTVLRMLNALMQCGYVYQEEDEPRRYGLTLRFLHIGQLASEHLSVRDIIHPYLHKLSQDTGEATCVAIRDGNVVRYIDVIENRVGTLGVRQTVGGSGKMHCTGSGKLFMMNFTREMLDEMVRQTGLQRRTEHTITDADALFSELALCRERGYATDDEECEMGVRCIAAPMFDMNQNVIAAISISGPVARMTPERIQRDLLPLLLETTKRAQQKVSG